MPNLKTYNLFISHAWKYGDDYSRVVNLLNYAPYFYYRNYSAPQEKPLLIAGNDVHNAAEIRSAIIQKIKPVHCVLIISGMYYNNRQWMQFEIDTAKKSQKANHCNQATGRKPDANRSSERCRCNCRLEYIQYSRCNSPIQFVILSFIIMIFVKKSIEKANSSARSTRKKCALMA